MIELIQGVPGIFVHNLGFLDYFPVFFYDLIAHGVPEGGKKQKKMLGYDTYIL